MIYDMAGYGYKNFSKDICKALISTASKVFTGHMKQQIVINSGFTVKLTYNMCSPFIHERSRKKFVFLGDNYNTNRDYLLSRIDEDQLPSDFGGTNSSIDEILDRYAGQAHEEHMQHLAEMEPNAVDQF